MILVVHNNSSYLRKINARSCTGGHFFISSNAPIPPVGNGAILTVAQILKHVMSSAAEAELAALYINACKAVYIQQILTELGHPQPQNPIQTDNSTAVGIVNNKILPKAKKSMKMRFH